MESNREVFLRMSEEYYLSVPFEIRESFLSSKRVDEEKGDWSENMKDNYYCNIYNDIKDSKKLLKEREYQLREERRKQLNK
jgi:peptide subunit release factor RF-3